MFNFEHVHSFNTFNTLTLKQIFWKTKIFFKKLEYRLFVESAKIDDASFSYKTAISEANVKATNKEWCVENGPITKNGVLPITALFFLKILFQFKNPL